MITVLNWKITESFPVVFFWDVAAYSHPHDVTGIVPAFLSRTLTFGYKEVSHSLIDKTG